jgi:hypothetical protein
MPTTSLTIRVSRREADRPRLLQARAFAGDVAVGALALRLEVDDNGTFHDEEALRERELVTAADGSVILQWYEWPRNGPARDFVSVVTVAWDREDVLVHFEDLFE